MEPVLCSIADAGRSLGLGRSKIYSLIAEKRLETVLLGRRRLVRIASVQALANPPSGS